MAETTTSSGALRRSLPGAAARSTDPALIQQPVDRRLPGAFDHELGPRLAQDRRGIVDELAGLRLDTKIDTALGLGGRSALRNVQGRGGRSVRR